MKTTISLLLTILTFTLSAPAEEKKGLTLSDALKKGRSAFHKGNYKDAKKYFSLIQKHKPGHESSRNYLAQIKVIEQERGGNPSLESKMKQIKIPKIAFNEATLREAIDYMVQTTATENFRANIILKIPPAKANQRINLQLSNVPFSYALKTAGSLAGVKFTYQEHAILGTPSS